MGLTLPQLQSKFSVTTRVVATNMTTAVQLAPANPLRWGIGFYTIATGAASITATPSQLANVGIPMSQLGSPPYFQNIDFPGLPQCEWVANANPTLQTVTVLEIIQNPE